MSLVPPVAASRPVLHSQILSPFSQPPATTQGTLLQHPLIRGWIDMSSAFAHGGSQNVTTNNAFTRPPPAPFAPAGPRSVLPAKRSDNDDEEDDLQFISAQPVKKRKIAGSSTKYQLKVTPPVPAPSPSRPPPQTDGYWRLPESPVAAQVQSGAQDHGKNADLAQERRVSTGMVGLLSDDIPEIEEAVAMRGVSLPSLESYVFGQSPRRPRPMASPPLSPKQLPSNFQPWALDSPPLIKAPSNHQTTPHPTPDAMDEDTIMIQAPTVDPSPSSRAANADQSRASSPAQDASADSHMTSMPAPISSKTQHEQIPDTLRQIPPSHPSMPPAGAARAHGAKQPCRICIQMAQREALVRAQGLPLAMVGRPMPTHAMPPMHGPPIPPYPHLHHQLASMPPTSIPGLGSGYLPMVMPIHQFNGILSHGSGTQPPPPLNSPQLIHHPSPKATATTMPPQTPTQTGESSQTTISTPKPRPGTPRSPFKPPASLIQPTYRKPSPNLIVDVAETCQEKFPFEEVAGRHNVPVDKVIEVFAAIIQVPLLRCPTDRRRPGKLATSRVKEYARARKGIQEERGAGAEGGASESRGEGTASPLEIAQRLGPVELPEQFEMLAQ